MLADTMKQVKAAEQQAADLVQGAKNQAAAVTEEAKTRAKQIIKYAADRAEADAKTALAGAREEGEMEKENYASQIRGELDRSMQQALKRSDAAVDAILANLV